MELEGNVAMITGGSAGLGAAMARRFAEEGAAVSICARSASALREVADEIRAAGGTCLAVATDVTNPDAVEGWMERTHSELGPVDTVVNNASILGERV
ncbi:MAG: SDR family NAD(P)-dependent oxidoreductase, partial [Gemmatimonadota bacterium]|nr:SDR family NAD(P)-dependent oxidoreductase [Gemmatimonadota bacterium]